MVGLFAATLFASAALLFWVQPMAARMLLPLLGGTPTVWITEGGFASAPTDQWTTRSEAIQAEKMTTWIQQMRAANVPVAIIYRAQDQTGDDFKWGLLRENGSAKPALAILRTS